MPATRDGWTAVDLGPVGRVACPPGWVAEAIGPDSASGAAAAPDGKARLIAHAVVHGADADGTDFGGRMEAAAERVIGHLSGRAGAEPPKALALEGAAQPILEISGAFFDDAETPRVRIRQWHALAPLDADARRIAIIAFSLMTPALASMAASADLADGFKDSLRQTAAMLSNGGI